MSKLNSVIRHEYLTVVKQKGFWAYMVTIPAIFLLMFLLIGIAGKTNNTSLDNLANDLQEVAIIDASGLVAAEAVAAIGQELTPVSEYEAIRQEVKDGERKGMVYYPANMLETRQYEIYVSGVDFIFSTTLSEIGGSLLSNSLYSSIGSEDKIALAKQGADGVTTTFANGTESVGFTRFIVPGAITILFVIILMFSVGYILTSIADEKENRSMEMALAYLSPRTLIVGKLIAVVLITLTQLLFFLALGVVAMVVAVNTNFIQLPSNFDITALPVDPVSFIFALAFLIVGFIMFAAFMAFLAVLLPAKQANNFSSIFYILPFVPSWFIWTVLTDPANPVVQFITYFPITAPTTSMIRNTVGNISAGEALLSLGIMAVVAAIMLWLVVKVFPKGALEFQNPLSWRAIFSKKS